MEISKARQSTIFLFITSFFSLIILLLFNGTGMEADSFHHHLIAKYSFQHPSLFFDHWGKPLYTFISSPFAQFDFIGSKILNVALSLGSYFMAHNILKEMRIKISAWVILICFIIPLSFQISFSSFTEPLFGFCLCLGIYLCLKNKFLLAAILISFLPMIRSEGLIFIIVFGLYFLYQKKFTLLPFLLFGQILYSLIGFLFVEKSFFWVFGEIPYATLDGYYGNGEWDHFFVQLFYILGPVLIIFFILSVLISPFQRIEKRNEYLLLVLFGFISFFIFHSLSWYMGWFNSLGLKRVFGAVIPLMGIIITVGLDGLLNRIKINWLRTLIPSIILLSTAALLFSKGPAGIDWKREMNLTVPQQLAKEVANFIQVEKIKYDRIIFADRYLARDLNVDPYQTSSFHLLDQEVLNDLKPSDLIIWDNWHAPVDFGINMESLENRSDIKKIQEFKGIASSREVQYLIYLKND